MDQSYVVADADLRHETERLREQLALTWAGEAARLRRWGITKSRALLELGCGPGFVTEALLRLVPKQTAITSLDDDARMIAFAGDRLAVENRWQGVTASIMATGLPNASYDFALARYLFEHLSDPVGAAREVWRVLQPGSPFVLIDIDEAWGVLLDPPFPELQRERLTRAARQALRGGNRFVGRRLPRILAEAGFTEVTCDTLLMHSDISGVAPFLAALAPITAAEAATPGLATSLRDFVTEQQPIIMLQLFLACGRKPKDAENRSKSLW